MTVEDGPGDTLNVSESVDSDELNNKDGDDVVDPPENWKGSDRFGTTLREEGEGEPLDERLAEEEPDVNADFAGAAAGASEALPTTWTAMSHLSTIRRTHKGSGEDHASGTPNRRR